MSDSPHFCNADFGCDCGPRIYELEQALKRLASAEGFEGAGVIGGGSFPERELRARMRFAEEALEGAELPSTPLAAGKPRLDFAEASVAVERFAAGCLLRRREHDGRN